MTPGQRMSILSELRRRNVFKVAIVYLVAAALLYWLIVVLQTQLEWPWWTHRLVAALLIIGLPPVLMFAWAYEITPHGLKKAVDVDQTQSIVFKTGQKLNAALAVLVVLAAVAMVADRLLPELAIVEPPPVPKTAFDPSPGAAVPPEIRSFTLDNGLRFIVWPDTDIPNVALYNYVRAGSRNEYPGITGLSHFFEHMMFNGTDDLPPGEFDRIMEAAGGANNAYTSRDVTVYQDWFPRSALETIFELEADRIENLAIDTDVLESERGVIQSERRENVDNDNTSLLFERMLATAYIAHPYRTPVIGWPSDIAAWTRQDLERFFRTYYAPNNLTIAIAGDVTADEIYHLADEHFAGLARREPPAEVRTVEPAQLGLRRFTIVRPAQTPLLHVAFHAGSATSPVTLPMELLLNILIGGDSSRLHRALVEDAGLALSVGGFQSAGFDPGVVYFYLTLPPGTDPAKVESELFRLLGEVATDGVSAAEMEKARNIMLADYWRELATIDGKAAELGYFEVVHGSYAELFERPGEIGRLTVEDLRQAAEAIFRDDNATIGALVAPPGDAPGDAPGEAT